MAELKSSFADVKDATEAKSLIDDTCLLLQQGLFDSDYNHIARVAPELRESFIYKLLDILDLAKVRRILAML
jgi:hypothetical protein